MKKTILIILSFIVMILSVSCTQTKSKTDNYYFRSEVYTDDEIRDAMKTVEKDFYKNGYCLENLKLYYKGDDKNEWDEVLKNNRGEMAIVLYSTFTNGKITKECEKLIVDPIPNKNYPDWSWSLVKDKDTDWKIVSGGYR